MTANRARVGLAMAQARFGAAVGLGMLSSLCTGCLVGKVLDPVTDNGIGATIETYARCTGGACTVPGEGWQKTTASSTGDFVYNAYADDDATLAKLELAAGREAFAIRISAPGYVSRTLAHMPSYQVRVDPNTGEPQRDASTGEPIYYTAVPKPVYLCPVDAVDSDNDTLCDLVEAKYGTNPYEPDTDQDGLDDAYELFGDEQLDLAGYGADPLHRDIFLEVDYYPGNELSDEAVHQLEDAFNAAPAAKSGGTPGIHIHILRDDVIAAEDADPDLKVLTLNYWAEFDKIKNKYAEKYRQPAFHYAVLADLHDGMTGGVSRGIPGHDFIVALSGYPQSDYAATIMHELGHNLGLNHGGPPSDWRTWKPNYLSIMSYQYAYSGVYRDGAFTLDYSRVAIDQLSERALDEVNAMAPAPGSATTEDDLAHYGVVIHAGEDPVNGPELVLLDGNAHEKLDFNRDGEKSGCCTQTDLNGNGLITDTWEPSQIDWDVLKFTGHPLGGGTIGIERPGLVEIQSEDEFVQPEACLSK